MRTSAGILVYRLGGAAREVLLGHMGGPFWAGRDDGAWSIPKGEIEVGEEPLDGARREFREEVGHAPPDGPLLDLGEVRGRGKRVRAWAVEGDFDPAAIRPGLFEMEWPPRSGRIQSFPELDRVAWHGLDDARRRVVKSQVELLDRLDALLDGRR
ncbi:MAG: NUDIX domain-containing protein [Thermoleophilia bacterium]